MGAWVGWRCWLRSRSLSSLEDIPARTASRLGSPVGARKALIGSWAAARAREALAPAERDVERDPERDVDLGPERDVDLGVVLGVVSVPRPPALRLGASPAVRPPALRLGASPAERPPALRLGASPVLRLGVSLAVRPVVLRWGAGCAAVRGPAWGTERAGAGGVLDPWLACRREEASSQALAPGVPVPAAPRPDKPG